MLRRDLVMWDVVSFLPALFESRPHYTYQVVPWQYC